MSQPPPSLIQRRPIRRLDDNLINQIAAGEVIDRPASVVKELLENSLDAGADRIDIAVKEGGKDEIRVIDNGCGMTPEDLKLSLERHATNKVESATDLETIMTYGFRGEALSSIAAVAELEIVSRTAQLPVGHLLQVDHGRKFGELLPRASAVGTSVCVRRLFEKVPARQKFLRSSGTEFSHCVRTVREIALSTPLCTFHLSHQGRPNSCFVAPTREARVLECLRVGWSPVKAQESNDGVKIEAYLSPGHTIQDRGDLHIYINARVVRNKLLTSAVRTTYQSLFGPHHEPSGVLYLDIRPDWVDVNVHPQKLEVRLMRQESLYQWLCVAIRKALTAHRTVHEVPVPVRSSIIREPEGANEFVLPEALYSNSRELPPMKPTTVSSRIPPIGEREPRPLEGILPVGGTTVRYLGQAKASYLVCEDAEGVVLIDQHALHEKIVYERLKNSFDHGDGKIQQLLVPRIFSPPSELLPVLEENTKLLNQLGFELECLGDSDIAIKSRPEMIEENKVETVLLDALKAIQSDEGKPNHAVESAIHPVLATMACHSVVRANQTLSPFEAEQLLGGLNELEEGWACPHGRPVLFRLSFRNIEKHFDRS